MCRHPFQMEPGRQLPSSGASPASLTSSSSLLNEFAYAAGLIDACVGAVPGIQQQAKELAEHLRTESQGQHKHDPAAVCRQVLPLAQRAAALLQQQQRGEDAAARASSVLVAALGFAAVALAEEEQQQALSQAHISSGNQGQCPAFLRLVASACLDAAAEAERRLEAATPLLRATADVAAAAAATDSPAALITALGALEEAAGAVSSLGPLGAPPPSFLPLSSAVRAGGAGAAESGICPGAAVAEAWAALARAAAAAERHAPLCCGALARSSPPPQPSEEVTVCRRAALLLVVPGCVARAVAAACGSAARRDTTRELAQVLTGICVTNVVKLDRQEPMFDEEQLQATSELVRVAGLPGWRRRWLQVRRDAHRLTFPCLRWVRLLTGLKHRHRAAVRPRDSREPPAADALCQPLAMLSAAGHPL